MIGKVCVPPKGRKRKGVGGLIRYLYREGSHHKDPHVIGGFQPAAVLEPPRKPGGKRDLQALVDVLEAPLMLIPEGKRPAEYTWHAMFRAEPGDRPITDAEWMEICTEAMHRTGLARRGQEDQAVPWVVVKHADDHVHIAAVLARPHGKAARLWQDRNTVIDVGEWAEKRFGLKRVARPGRGHGGPKRAGRAETEKAARRKRPAPARDELRRHAEAAAAAAVDETDFFARLEARGVVVRPRRGRGQAVTGYSLGLPGDHAPDGGQMLYGGNKLSSGLSLPRLRKRWGASPPTGRHMKIPVAKAILKREVTAAAAASANEAEFTRELKRRGVDIEFRHDPERPGRRTGYTVTLPGLTDRAGEPRRFSGGTLSPDLTLGTLRARWRSGNPGASPPGLFDGTDAALVWEHATEAARTAAADLQAGTASPATVMAAADVLTAAADVTGSAQLRAAADSFGRAALPARGPVPPPDPLARALRTAARALSASRPPGRYSPAAPQTGGLVLALLVALVLIAMILTMLRLAEGRRYEARHALDAAMWITIPDDARPRPPVPEHADAPRIRRAAQRPAAPPPARRHRGSARRGTGGSRGTPRP